MKIRQITSHLTIFALLYSQIFLSFSSTSAFAQELPIQADGSTNTQVTQTASGVDQINIAAPNSSGISHNTFTDYNINNGGQIINNFSGRNPGEIAGGTGENAVTKTEIAGFVNVNQNLVNSGSAAIILNEVTSTNNSELRGYAEIAGSRAELIIANPNGITCSGCGFINTSRLSFIAGSSAYDANGNLNFNVRENISAGVPLITISGLGLDASATSSASIIASSIKLLSTIYGGETVSLIGGDGNYDYKTGGFRQNQGSASVRNPELFAIDATNLGAVQAGRIFIIANRDGVGVNLGGDILASKDISIDVAGNLSYKKIAANENVNIGAKGDVANADSGAQIISQNVVVSSDGDIVNYGSISGAKVDFDKANLIRNFGEIAANDLTLSAFDKIENSGLVYGENSLMISGGALDNNGLGVIYSSPSFAINLAENLQNRGRILSNNSLNIKSSGLQNYNEISALSLDLTSGDVYNEGKIFAQNLVNITAADLENAEGGVISSKTTKVIIAGDDIENSGEISAKKDLEINSTNITNSGKILAFESLNLTAKEDLSNSNLIWGGGFVDAKGKNIYNEGSDAVISSASLDVKINSAALIKNSGEISTKNKLTIAFGDLENSGSLLANSLNLTGANLVNKNEILANQLLIKANLTNSGDITSNGALNIDAQSLLNFNKIIAVNGDFVIDLGALGVLENKGLIQAKGANLLIKNGDKIDNTNAISAKNLVEIKGAKNLTNSKEISAQNLDIEVKGGLNNKSDQSFIIAQNSSSILAASLENEGLITAKEQIINVDKIDNEAMAEISAGEKLTINNKLNFDNLGKVLSAKDLTINSENVENKAIIYAKEKLSINAQSLENEGVGEINAQNIDIIVINDFVNKSKIISSNNLKISSENFSNDAIVAASFNLNILAKDDLKNSGQISSGNDLTLDAKTINNSSKAIIISQKNFELKALDNITNNGEIVSKQGLAITSINTLNNYNLISAGNISEIETAKIANHGGAEISAFGAINIGKTNSIINEGKIIAAGNLNIGGNLAALENNGKSSLIASSDAEALIDSDAGVKNFGTIFAKLALNINAAGDVANDNIINSQNDLVKINAVGDIKNNSTISATTTIALAAKNLENGADALIFSKNDIEIIAQNEVKNAGEIAALDEVVINANDLENKASALVTAAKTDLKINNKILNSGEISANNILKISTQVGGLENGGNIISQNDLTINSQNSALLNEGLIFAKNSSSIQADSLLNKGKGEVSSNKNSLINLKNSLINQGNILANDNLNIAAKGVANSGNIIAINDNAEIDLGGASLENEGVIQAKNADLVIENGEKIDNTNIISAKNLVEIKRVKDLQNSKEISSQNLLNIELSGVLNNAGDGSFIAAQNSSTLAANKIYNEALITSKQQIIKADNIENKAAGEISASENLTINVKETLENKGKILSNKTLSLNSLNTENESVIYAGERLALNANNLLNQKTGLIVGGNVVEIEVVNLAQNSGEISAKGNVGLNAGEINNNAQSLILSQSGDLKIISTGKISNSGFVVASKLVTLEAGGDIVNQGAINSKDIVLKGADLKNSGLIKAKEDLEISAKIVQNDNKDSALEGNNIKLLASGSLINFGEILALKQLIINAQNVENNGTDSVIFAQEKSEINAVLNIKNSGEVSSNDSLVIKAASLSNLENSKIVASKLVQINLSGLLENFANILSHNEVKITAQSLNNAQGATIFADDKNDISLTQNLENLGKILSNDDVVLTAQSINNKGAALIFADDIIITSQEKLTNSAEISAVDNLNINAKSLENNKLIKAKNADFLITENLINSKEISALANLTIAAKSLLNAENSLLTSGNKTNLKIAQSIDNSGEISSGLDLEVFVSSLENKIKGLVIAKNIALKAEGDLNNNSKIIALEKLEINADKLSNKDGAAINSGGVAQINVLQDLTNNSQIFAQNNLDVKAKTFALGSSSVVAANNNLNLTAALNLNNAGDIYAANELFLNADSLTNSDVITAGLKADLKVTLALENYGEISSSKDLLIKSKSLQNEQNSMIAASDVSLDVEGDVANLAKILANNNLNIKAQNLDNGATALIAGKNSSLKIAKNLTNLSNISGDSLTVFAENIDNKGAVVAKNNSSLNAANLDNQGLINASAQVVNAAIISNKEKAEISATVNLSFEGASLVNAGKILSNKNLTINSKTLENKAIIFSKNELVLNVENLTNQLPALIASDMDVKIIATKDVVNFGEISSSALLAIDSGNLKNEALIQGQKAAIKAAADLENKGKILAGDELVINANKLTNKDGGLIAAENVVKIEVAGDVLNESAISGKVVALGAKNLNNNSAGVVVGQDLSVYATENLKNSGKIYGQNSVKIGAKNLENIGAKSLISGVNNNEINIVLALENEGEISSSKKVFVKANSLNNKKDAGIISLDDMEILATEILTNNGNIFAKDNSSIAAQSLLNQEFGAINSNLNNLTITQNLTNFGDIAASSELKISAGVLNNETSGLIFGQDKNDVKTAEKISNAGEISSKNSLILAANELENKGDIIAKNSNLKTTQTIVNSGEISAIEGLNILANSLENKDLGLIGGNVVDLQVEKNIDNKSKINAANALKIKAAGLANWDGALIVSGENNVINLTENFANSGVVASKALEISTQNLNNNSAGVIFAQNLSIEASEAVKNYGQIYGENSVKIGAKNLENIGTKSLISGVNNNEINVALALENEGEISSNKKLLIKANSLNNKKDAKIISLDDLDVLTAQSLANNGTIFVKDNSNITAQSLVNEEFGVINSDASNKLTSANLENKGKIFAKNELVINADNFANRALALIASDKDVNIIATKDVVNFGEISSSEKLTIKSENLQNSALINGKVAALNLAQSLENQGTILSDDELLINSHKIDNKQNGVITAGDLLTIKVSGDVLNAAIISSNEALNIAAANLTNNSAALIFAKDLSVYATENLKNSRQIYGQNSLKIGAKNLENIGAKSLISGVNNNEINVALALENEGEISSNKKLLIKANSLNNKKDAKIISLDDLEVLTAQGLTNNGNIFAKDSSNIAAQSLVNEDTGAINSNQNNLTITQNLTNFGDITATLELKIIANSLSNEDGGLLLSQDKNDLKIAQKISNAGEISSKNILTLAASELENNGEIIAKNSNLKTTGGLVNKGEISAIEALNISANNLENKQEALIAGAGLDLEVAQNIDNKSEINSAGSLKIKAAGLVNANKALIISKQNNVLNLSGGLTNSGAIAGKVLEISAQNLNNNSSSSAIIGDEGVKIVTVENTTNAGEIYSGKKLEISANELTNNGAALIAGEEDVNVSTIQNLNNFGAIFSGKILNISAGDVDNLGKINSTNSLTIAAKNNIANKGNIITKASLLLTAGNLINNSNLINAQNISNISAKKLVNISADNSEFAAEISALTSINISGVKTLENKAKILAQGNLTIENLESLSNESGAALASIAGDLTIKAQGDINNDAALLASNALNISGANLNNKINGKIISQKSTVTIQVAGDVENKGEISGGDDVILEAIKFINSGRLYANDNLNLTLTGDFANSGKAVAANDINITAKNIDNFSDGLISSKDSNLTIAATKIINLGEISAGSNLSLNTQEIENSAKILTQNQLTINAKKLENKIGSALASLALDVNLNIANEVKNLGVIFAKNNLEIALSGENSSLINSGNISANLQKITVINFDNSGQIFSDNNLEILAVEALNSGDVKSNNNLKITAQNLKNSALILGQKTSEIKVSASLLNEENGVIASNDNLEISANNVNNSGKIIAAKTLNLSAGQLYNFNLINALDLNISLENAFENKAEISANNDLKIKFLNGQIKNSGKILAQGNVDLESASLSNESAGAIASIAKNLNIKSTNDITNLGVISAALNAEIRAANLVNNKEIAAQNLNFIANNLTNYGVISAAQNIDFSLENSLTNADDSQITAQNNLKVLAKNIVNNGNILAQKNLTLNAQEFKNDKTSISASLLGDADISIEKDFSNEGNIFAKNNLVLSAQNLVNNSAISGENNLTINAQGELKNNSEIVAQKLLTLNLTSLINNKDIAANDLKLTLSGNFTNNQNARLIAQNDLILSGADSVNYGLINAKTSAKIIVNSQLNSGEISSADELNIDADLLTNSGKIIAKNNLVISSQNLTNEEGGALASLSGDVALSVSQGSILNEGEISASKNLNIVAADLENLAKIYAVNQSLTISNSLVNNDLIFASRNLTISSKDFDNSSLTKAGEVLKISSTNNIKNSGEISSNEVEISAAEKIENSNKILAQNNLTISAKNLENKGDGAIASLAENAVFNIAQELQNLGKISAQKDLKLSAASIKNSKLITAKNKLEITSAFLDNSDEISSLGGIKINNSAAINNSGDILAKNLLEITTQNLTNSSGATIASLEGGVKLDVSLKFTNAGLTSGQSLKIINGEIVNSGEISSAGDLEISAQKNITNSGKILAQGDLKIDLLGLTEIVQSVGPRGGIINTTVILGGAINNSGEILAQNNLEIDADISLTNSNKIYAKNNLILESATINNSAKILADNQITINATTLNNNTTNSLILAQDDLNIFATQVNNQNTREANGGAVNSGLISRSGDINLRANGLNNSSGLIMGHQNFLSALNAQSVSLNNNAGKFVSNQQISLDLGDIDYAISGEITAQNIDITARNIYNTGNVTAFDFIKLKATGNADNGHGNFINGISNTNNINVVLSAGSYVDIVTNGVLINYGTISAEGDLRLVSNQRNVENFGHIKSGNNLSITSDNAIILNLPTAVISAENNLNLSAVTLANYAEISAGNDLEINAGDDYFNIEGAVTYSGRDSTFNIGDSLINSFSTIYAERNLNLQRNNSSDAAQNKMNSLKNVSGNIETYAGDINIKAWNINNIRSEYRYLEEKVVPNYLVRTDSPDLSSLIRKVIGNIVPESKILSGFNIDLNFENIENKASSIISAGNMKINGNNIINNSFTLYEMTNVSNGGGKGWCPFGNFAAQFCFGGGSWYYVQGSVPSGYSETYTAYIKSGGSLTITQNGNNISGGMINGGNVAQNVGVQTANQRSANITVNGVDTYALAETGEVNIDLSRITAAINDFSAQTSSASVSQNQQISSIDRDSKSGFSVQILEVGSVNNISGVVIGGASQNVNAANFSKANFANQGGNLAFAVKSSDIQAVGTLNSNNFTTSQTSTISTINNNSEQSSTINHSVNLPSANVHNIATNSQTTAVQDKFTASLASSNSATSNQSPSQFQVNDLSAPAFNFQASPTSSIAINSQTFAGQSGFNVSGVTVNSAINQLPTSLTKLDNSSSVEDFAPSASSGLSQAPIITSSVDNLSKSASTSAAPSQVHTDIQANGQITNNSFDKITQIGDGVAAISSQKTTNNQALQNQTIAAKPTTIGEISTSPITISEIDNSQTQLGFADVNTESAVKYSGNFKINLTPSNNAPIIEKRVDFTNLNNYFGSKDYFIQLGFSGDAFLSELNQYQRGILNSESANIQAQNNSSCLENPARCNAIFDPNDNNKASASAQIYFLGDAYVETTLIRDTLSKIRNDALYLSDAETDINQEIKSLLDNSVAEVTRLNIDLKNLALNGLSKEQQQQLDKDIITFEVIEINGIKALAPKIYLSQNSIDKLLGSNVGGGNGDAASSSLAANSSIYARENLTINAPDAVLTNSGSIKAGNNINLNVASLSNKSISFAGSDIGGISNVENLSAAVIFAKNNLTITANTGDIKNIAANLSANNQLSLTSLNGSIVNSALVATNDANLLASNSDAYITNGRQSLNIANNASNLSGNISSALLGIGNITGGLVLINAENDFTNLASNIEATKNTLEDNTKTSGNLTIQAGDDIDIKTLELRNRTETTWGSRKKGGSSISDNVENVASNVEGGGDVVLLTSGAGNDSEGQEVQTLFNEKEQKISTIQNQINGLNPNSKSYSSRLEKLNNQIDSVKEEYQSEASKIALNVGSNVNVIGSNIKAGGNASINSSDEVNIIAAANTSYNQTQSWKRGATTNKASFAMDYSLENLHSNIESKGDIEINSQGNTNLIGANLAAANVATNAGDELNIQSVADKNYSYSNSTKSRNFSNIPGMNLTSINFLSDISDVIPVPIISNIASLAKNDFNFKSSLNERDSLTNRASNINASGDIELNSQSNVNIVGSNINGVADTNISSNTGDVNIASVTDYDNVRSETFKSKTTFSSVGAGLIQATAAGISSAHALYDATKTPDQKYEKIKENNEAGENTPKKTFSSIAINRDETVISSNLNSQNIAINSGRNINLTSSAINAGNGLNLNSAKDVNIYTVLENDYSYNLTEKKTPTIAAAMSNSIVKLANDSMPNFNRDKDDQTESNSRIQDLVYDISKNKVETTSSRNISSSLLARGDIDISSGENILISASNLSAENIDINAANGAVVITSATDKLTQKTETINQDYNDISTNYNRGRASLDSNFNVAENTTTTTQDAQKQSVLNSANNINITSKKDLNILSSNLAAKDGEINLTAKEGSVNILALQNTETTSSETKTGNLALSMGVGNAHVDAAYAANDLVEAGENLKHAKENLNRMETMQNNGAADSDAVEDARINLTIANLNFALAEVKFAASVAKSAAAASGSLGTGFYGDIRLSIDGSKTNANTSTTTSVASNVEASGNITIKSGLDLRNAGSDVVANTTITGSNLTSQNGDINITSKDNTFITASKDTYASSSKTNTWQENYTLASSVAGGAQIDSIINNLQMSLGLAMSQSKSDASSTNYNNSTLTAENGTIKINSIGDLPSEKSQSGNTTISGANILAQDVVINSSGNLKIESLQNSYKEKGSSFGFNLGGGAGLSTSSPNGSIGVNYSSNKTDRLWVDNQTSIIGADSVTINTGENTEIKGAIIANIANAEGLDLANKQINSKNLKDAIDGGVLAVNTKSLTTENIYDHDYRQSSGFGLSTSIGRGAFNPNNTQGSASANNPNQQSNYFPNGSTTISMQDNGYRKEQTTKATVGNGDITIGSTQTFDADGNAVNSTGGVTNDQSELANLNRDVNKSQEITKDTITAALDVEATIDNRIIAAAFGSEGAQNELLNEQLNIKANTKTSTKELAKLIDAPLVLTATANIPFLSEGASYLATKDGSIATLATQLFGLGYVLGTNDYRLIIATEDKSKELTGLLKEASESDNLNFKLTNINLDNGQLKVTDKLTGEERLTVNYNLTYKNLDDLTLTDYLMTSDMSGHGINNTGAEGYRNGRLQLGGLQNINQQTGNGTFAIGSAPSHGVLPDIVENIYNTVTGLMPFGSYLKSGNVIAGNEFKETQAAIKNTQEITLNQNDLNYLQSQNINTNVNSKDRGGFYNIENTLSLLRFADHSNGVDREYYSFQSLYQPNTTLGEVVQVVAPPAVVNSLLEKVEDVPQNKIYGVGEYYDSVAKETKTLPGAFVQGYGGATETQHLGEAANDVGVWMDHTGSKEAKNLDYSPGHLINFKDPVPNIMGANSNSLQQTVISAGNVIYLGDSDKSPHGTYICSGPFCGYDGFEKLKQLQQKPMQQ